MEQIICLCVSQICKFLLPEINYQKCMNNTFNSTLEINYVFKINYTFSPER